MNIFVYINTTFNNIQTRDQNVQSDNLYIIHT